MHCVRSLSSNSQEHVNIEVQGRNFCSTLLSSFLPSSSPPSLTPYPSSKMEIESGRSTPTGGAGSRSSSPYLSLGTQDPSSFDISPGGGAAAAGVPAAAAGATHFPPPSSSSSSSAAWRRPLSVLMSTRNVVGQILTFSRGGMECPMPFLCDEEHPDPFVSNLFHLFIYLLILLLCA